MSKILYILKHLKIYDILLVISFFVCTSNTELNSITFPTTYVLLNQHIVLVANESIFFFSPQMELDESKKVTLIRPIETLEQYAKTAISQFSADNGDICSF